MRIDNLEIRHFGRKSNLCLHDLTPRINVVMGPNGAGKSTTIQFIRWMLFGHQGDLSQRYLRESAAPAAGTLSFSHQGLPRTVSRQDDGTRSGLISMDQSQHFDPATDRWSTLLKALDVREFDQLYAPDFQQDFDICDLLRTAQARGLALTGQRVADPRVPELRLRIDNLRRDMDRLPWRASDLPSLVNQKRALESRLSMLEEDSRRRRLDYDREYQEITRHTEQLEQEITRLREQWHAKDDHVTARRRELEAAWRAAEEAKQEYLRQRREEVASIDANLGRARAMMNEVRSRYDRVDAQVREHHLDESTQHEDNATVCLVNSIAQQLDEIRQQPQTAYDAASGRYRPSARVDLKRPANVSGVETHSRFASPATLDTLRQQVGQLCRTLQDRESQQQGRHLTGELEQLEACDRTMASWIANLTEQREQVAAELEKAQQLGVSLVAGTAAGDMWAHPVTIAGQPGRPDNIKAVPHACDSYTPLEPEADPLLRRLTAERDAVNRDLEAAERRLRQLLDRRRELEAACGRLRDQEIETTRRELVEIDALIQAAEQRERMQRDIGRLEVELRRLQDGSQESTIMQQANEILRKLTINRLIAIHLNAVGNADVEDETGQTLPYGQLSLGTRGQVYLSLMLTLVSANRARGIDLPLLLHDVFSHIDSQQDDALAAVLHDFAAAGQQIIVFTRHQHVVQLFQPYRARVIELDQVEPIHPTPSEQDLVEAVRFRPRDEDAETLRSVRTARQLNRQKFDQNVPPPSRFLAARRKPSASRSTGNQWPVAHTKRQTIDRDALPRDYYNVTLENEEYAEFIPTPRPRQRAEELDTPVVTSPSYPAAHIASPSAVDGLTIARSSVLSDLQIIDPDVVSRLRAMSIVTVDEFLSASPAAIDRELRSWGLATKPIRRWQDELRLRCHVPSLSANEARLLVAAGVTDLQALADCEADTLARQLMTLLYARSGPSPPSAQIDVARTARWVTTARRRVANYRQAGTSNVSARESYPATYFESESDNLQQRQQRQSQRDDRGQQSARGSRSRRNQDEPGLLGASSSGNRQRRSRQRRTDRQLRSDGSSRTSGPSQRASISRSARPGGELKFYLDRSAVVEDAPSIGPRTAERLLAIGITTVADLLAADPDQAASRIEHRRISATKLRQWQAQAILCCCVPMLRGHDAQILVAVGVTDPDQLAGMSAEQLWNMVRPFTDTTECKRIVRNGKMPDEDEIADWISWAKQARALSAA